MNVGPDHPTSPDDRSPKVSRSWLKHPLTIGVIPVAVGAILATLFAYLPHNTAAPATSLEVNSVAVRPATYYPEPVKVDFQLRNTGNQLALLKTVQLRVREFALTPICLAQGGLPITGNYRTNMPTQPKIGSVIDIPISQQVGPDAAENFEISLRSAPPPKTTDGIRIYRVSISLLYNRSSAVDAGDALCRSHLILMGNSSGLDKMKYLVGRTWSLWAMIFLT